MRKDVFQTFNLGQLSESKSTFPMRQWGVTASLVQADYRYPWIRHWAKKTVKEASFTEMLRV